MAQSRRDFMTEAIRWSAGLALSAGAIPMATKAMRTKPQNTINQVDAASLQRFVASIEGHTIRPGDGDYDHARQMWNLAFDKHPGLIVFCKGSSDVARTVEFASRNEILLAVRSSGHSLAGKSSCDGGLVIDLSGLKNVRIDPVQRIAHAEAGVTLGEFDQASQAYGLATNSGTEVSVAVAGLTLGGGLGWLMGKYGLACDNLRSVAMVLADGRTVTASHTDNEDLFWAVRGAGANFGVVTALEYDLHPVDTVLAGAIQFPLESLTDALKHYRDFARTIPDEVGMTAGLVPGRDGKLILSLAVCYCGDVREGEKALQDLRRFRPVLFDNIQPMSYVAFQKLAALPPDLKLCSFVRSSFLDDLSDAAIDVMATHARTAPPLIGAFVIEYVHGKASRVPVNATAFPHRITGYNFSLHADWILPADQAGSREWGFSFWNAMQPYLRSAVYSNYLENEGPERIRAAYGANYERLARLKDTYDPTNLFCMNQNIQSARNIFRSTGKVS